MDPAKPGNFDDPSGDRNPLDAPAEEFVARYRRGERPSISEYAKQYPELADELRELLPALVMMEDVRPCARDVQRRQPLEDVAGGGLKLERIGDYRILREVGRGGMGIVYEAEQESLGRHVALKVLPKHALLDPRQLERFRCEARAAARLHHTNIVPVFGVGEQDGLHYHVMQFIQGLGLDEVLVEVARLRDVKQSAGRASTQGVVHHQASSDRRNETSPSAAGVAQVLISGQFHSTSDGSINLRGVSPRSTDPPARPSSSKGSRAEQDGSRIACGLEGSSTRIHLPGQDASTTESGAPYWRSVARIGVQVAEALAYANAQGVLHRDVKPSNLLLDTNGTVWITDFGLAKAAGSDDLTHTGDVVGTLRYMAPERFQGHADQRSDIYSLGITLYELLTLRHPFAESDRHKLVRQIGQQEPARPRSLDRSLPRDLETIVLKAIAKRPADRYATADALAADLRHFLEDKPIEARRIGHTERLWRWSRRNPTISGLTAAVALLAVVVGGGATFTRAVVKQRNRAVVAELEARQSLNRAELAERALQIRSHLAQATAHRRSGRMGQRFLCLEELIAAVRLDPSDELRRELRDEAIAALGLSDLRVQTERTVGLISGPQCDFQLKRYAFVDFYGGRETIVRRFDDDRELLRVPHPGFDFWHATSDFTPDGQYLLITYFPPIGSPGDAVLHAWHLDRQERVLAQETRSGDVIGAVAAHEQRLFFVNRQSELCVWDLGALREEKRLPLGMIPYSICVDADGRRVAVNDFLTPLVRLLSIENGDELTSWATNVGRYAMAWSSDGQLLASGSDDGQIFVWSVPRGELVETLKGHGSIIRAAFAHRGHLLATSGWAPGGTTQLWDAATGAELVHAFGQMVRFSEDDRHAGFVHGTKIGVWELAHRTEARWIQPASLAREASREQAMLAASFSPDGQLLATTGASGIWFWDRLTGEELGHMACGPTRQLLFCADGRGFIADSVERGVCFWPVQRHSTASHEVLRIGPPALLLPLNTREGFTPAHPMAWLPGQRSVAVADNVNHRVIIAAVDPTNGSGDDSIVLPSRHGRITNLAVSPDGRWVAAGGWKESGIQIWNLPKRRLETVRRAGDSKTGARFWVYFSPDNRWLVSAVVSDESCTYVAYSVGSWQRAWSQAAELETNPGVAFSADGRSMALSMSPTQVLIADPYDGRELVRMTSGEPHYALPAAFSDEASEVVLNPGFRPMAWWNLIRLRDRLTQLGLAWEHQSERAEYEERETLPAASHATASTDGWSVKDSPAVRRKLFIDLGDFSPSNRANDKTSVAENHVRLGRFLLETGNWASALSAFDCALELTPNNATMHNNLAWLVATCPNPGQPQVAWSLKAAARAVELEPANASFHNTLGVALYRDGQWQAAITQLTIAEELAPGKWFAHNTLFLAMTNWRLGDQPTARDWYSKAVTWLEQNSTAQHDEELARFRAEAEAMLAIQPEASRSTP